jgi:septum site-determining protein MinC
MPRQNRPSTAGEAEVFDLATGAPRADVDPDPTLLIRRHLRSGQRVRFAGNVVVLGDVNPGAEIQADGDIVVMGTLRGLAHAGARGDASRVIVAFRLAATQLRIARFIARAPEDDTPPAVPEVAVVRDGQVLIDSYTQLDNGR